MKWLHNLLKGISLTGALFVFQACYGTPQTPLEEEEGFAPMTFSLVSRATGEPLEGIKIKSRVWETPRLIGTTGSDGKCHVEMFYYRNRPGPVISFEDSTGTYMTKDTVLADLRERDILIKMEAAE